MGEKNTKVKGASCRNCGQPTGPRFCGHCGQEVEDGRQPLLQLFGELVRIWVSFDSRIVRTVKALVIPGRLTQLYQEGKKAPYLRPLRLYFLASLVLFSSTLDLRAPRADEVNLTVGGELVSTATSADGHTNLTIFSQESKSLWWVVDDSDETLERMRAMPPQDLLEALFSGLRRVLPAALVLFVPLFALALKLLYVRGRILYVDHLVFAVHVQSALFFALTLTWVLARLLGLGSLQSVLAYVLVGLLVLLVYLTLALRRVYRQSRLLTAAKTLAVLTCYAYLMQVSVGLSMILVIMRI